MNAPATILPFAAKIRNPSVHIDPVAAVTRALVDGPDPQKTITELVELTSLRRGDVVSAIASLAGAGRAIRDVTDADGVSHSPVEPTAMTFTLAQAQALGLRSPMGAVNPRPFPTCGLSSGRQDAREATATGR